MASATQSTIEEPDTRLSTTFYAELLKTGVFSDITFKYGKQHTFKLHSVVLKPKSTWFATHCKDNSKQMSHNIDIFDDGLSIECLNNFNPRLIEHCSEHAAGDRCISADHFTSLLEFCYLNNYPPQLWTGIGRQTLCFSHIYMYCLAKRFGVDSLLVLSATGFAHTMSLLLLENKNETAFIRFINLVYDLPVLEEDDLLRVKARQQAAKFAGGEFIRLRNSFVKGVKQSRVTKAMPKAGQDLLTCSLSSDVFDLAQPIPDEPSTPEVSTKAHTCVRCTVSLNAGAASPDSKLCDKCKPKAHSCSNVALPPSRGNSMTLTFWTCGTCKQHWNSDGPKKHEAILNTCPACPGGSVATPKPHRKKHIDWKCSGCSGVWRAFALKFKEVPTMQKCVCCPSKP